MERRGRKESIITLTIMFIIAIVIVSWLSGLWSCETGRKELTDEERLTISDYVNSISVLVQQSNKVSYKFFNTMAKAKELSREDLDSKLLEIIEESKVILENSRELNPPEFFEVAHGYLELVFDTRNKAYEDFKPALSNALRDLDLDISTTQITNTFLYMFMSDEIYLYFQDKLKESGEKLGIKKLTIIDSVTLKNRSLTNTQSVMEFISEIKTVTELQQRRGVAVIEDSIKFDPQMQNEQGDYLILANGSKINVAIDIQNQGNVVENNVIVVMKYMTEGNVSEEKQYTITSINPSENKVVTISGFIAYPGRKCELEITAGPVPGEVRTDNNTVKYKFMMEED
ncbi:MAG: hypothetical protein IMZ45_02130 [Actinobacteria bacterium]|nr:hypothetical protein [Actinomycetota bacterium]MBE3113409.1 hypothetical protein [Actinomycetota bacterium]MBE3114363.1 hypothetical protein [Actinomycetota bacterium]